MDGLSYPTADGTSGQFLSTDGSGNLTFASVPAGVGGANGVDFNDDVKARFGTGNDLEIFHDGSNSNMKDDVGTGKLVLRSSAFTVGAGVDIKTDGGSVETYNNSKFIADGAVELYHDNSKKFATNLDW